LRKQYTPGVFCRGRGKIEVVAVFRQAKLYLPYLTSKEELFCTLLMRLRLPASKGALHWLNRLQPSETVLLGGASLLVGLLSGMGVWVFKRLIDLFHLVFFGGIGSALASLGGWTIALVPALGGLVVGLLMSRFVGPERHHGVAGIMEAVALAGGRLRYRKIPAKAVAAALSIGAGALVGPEDPSVRIGASVGSMFGQWLRLSDDRVRTLVAAGAAGGISAAFNAPIAGIFFALEIILGEFSGSAFGVVLAAVILAMFTQAVSGTQPAFPVHAYSFHTPLELPLYIGLGLLAGPLAALYIRALYFAQDRFHEVQAPIWTKPAMAGLMVGVIGIFCHKSSGSVMRRSARFSPARSFPWGCC
jgi:chloride channel protein, CIC family